jgi:hypothetical protein
VQSEPAALSPQGGTVTVLPNTPGGVEPPTGPASDGCPGAQKALTISVQDRFRRTVAACEKRANAPTSCVELLEDVLRHGTPYAAVE